MALCERRGCEREARWSPAIEMRPEVRLDPAIGGMMAVLDVDFCDECRAEAKLEDIVTDGVWFDLAQKFSRGYGGRIEPDRSRARLHWTEAKRS
jgi:hypothetical protein